MGLVKPKTPKKPEETNTANELQIAQNNNEIV